MHGYEIHQQLAEASGLGLVWRLKQSQLYALLTKLEREGLVIITIEYQEARPPRKMFELTEVGRQAFLDWVQRPVAQGRKLRLDFLAKRYFARLEGPEVATRLIERQRLACRNWLRQQEEEAEALRYSQPYDWLVHKFRLPGSRHPIGYVDSNPDGDDGAPLTDYDVSGSAEAGTGLFALAAAEDARFVCIPPLSRDCDVGPGVLLVAARFCREHNALLIVDPPAAWHSSDDALRGLREFEFRSEHALMCFPRIVAFDRLRGRPESFANCGAVAGTLARLDEHRSPWQAGPDEELLLRLGTRPQRVLGDAERQRLAAHGINPLQALRSSQTRGGGDRRSGKGGQRRGDNPDNRRPRDGQGGQ